MKIIYVVHVGARQFSFIFDTLVTFVKNISDYFIVCEHMV